MANGPRAPKAPTSTSESQRSAATTAHVPTTFLTKADDRAASAYAVQTNGVDIGASQRARQEHAHGAALTSAKPATHAFTDTKQQQRAVAHLTKKDAKALGVDPQIALRMQIMDGLAKPRASHGAQHLEAFSSKLGRGNPHRSGGTVTFASSTTPLGNYSQVAANTLQKAHEEHTTGTSTTPSVTGPTTTAPTAAARQFNRAAVAVQQKFASAVMAIGKK